MDAVDRLTRELAALTEVAADRPRVVALDGRSGVGKSTLAAAAARAVSAGVVTVIDGDDFYSGGTAEEWDAMSAVEKCAHGIDWRRQRVVLEELARTGRASWRPYDWEADDGRLSPIPLSCGPADVVVLEGAYSARPELADLLDLRVLLTLPTELRRQRLLEREGAHYRAEWEARWSEAEHYYFTEMMPEAAFDLILRGS